MKQTAEELERLVELVTTEVYRRLRDLSPVEPVSHAQAAEIVQNMMNAGAARFGSMTEAEKKPLPLREQIAGMIDHTLLKPDASADQIHKLCEEAAKYHFATVCVNSTNVGLAAKLLQGSGVKAIAVVGFPLGASTPASKAFETLEAIREGAGEIDMVINIGALKSKDYKLVYDDMKSVVEAAGIIPVKVILETSTLSIDEKIIGSALSKAAGAAFVKTSTGFGGGGATVEDIRLMRRIVGPEIGVKASGGVRTFEDAQKFIEAGANRLGASASVEIVTGHKSTEKGY